jgi:hypothetical protein
LQAPESNREDRPYESQLGTCLACIISWDVHVRSFKANRAMFQE